jgi:hypothetical protein
VRDSSSRVRSSGEEEPTLESHDKVRDYVASENRKIKDELMRFNLNIE